MHSSCHFKNIVYENKRISLMIKFKMSYFKYLTENFITFKILTLINGTSLNLSETAIILKCVSDPLGTLCIYDSFIISI